MSWKDTPVCGCHAPRDGQEFSGRTLYALAHVSLSPRPRPPMSMPHHPCAARPPRAQTLPAHGDPQQHVCTSRPRPRPSHTRSACPRRSPATCTSHHAPPQQTSVIAGLVHRHAQQRDGSIAHTGTSGMMTPHGKNESIARWHRKLAVFAQLLRASQPNCPDQQGSSLTIRSS